MKNAKQQMITAINKLYQTSGYVYRDEKGIYWIMKQGNAYIKKYINTSAMNVAWLPPAR